MRAVCLNYILPHKEFIIQCDASEKGISGVLFQIDDEGNHRIVSLVSRCLFEAESRFTTTERELLAIIYTIHKNRYYLIGVKFKIVTDHKSLIFLHNTKFQNSRLIRWTLLLQQFSFTIVHYKGNENVVADFFSRNLESKFLEEVYETLKISTLYELTPIELTQKIDTLLILALNENHNDSKSIFKNLSEKQKQDKNIARLLHLINDKNESLPDFYIHENVLFHKNKNNLNWRIVVPEAIQKILIKSTYEKLGHPGVYKTETYLKRFYYWRTLHREVEKNVITCDLSSHTSSISQERWKGTFNSYRLRNRMI